MGNVRHILAGTPVQAIGPTQPTNADQIITMQSMAGVNAQPQYLKEPMLQQPQQQDIKHIELPKISANQQLFSLNTITNQITQLSSGISTASLAPMERLLIVPAGVNKQQLAKCLLQGQIHFDNTGKRIITHMYCWSTSHVFQRKWSSVFCSVRKAHFKNFDIYGSTINMVIIQVHHRNRTISRHHQLPSRKCINEQFNCSRAQ